MSDCQYCLNRRSVYGGTSETMVALECVCGVKYAWPANQVASIAEAAPPIAETLMTKVSRSALLAPITNINERSPHEVYAIMCNRIRSALRGD